MTKPEIYDIIVLHRVGGDCVEDASVNKRIINEKQRDCIMYGETK